MSKVLGRHFVLVSAVCCLIGTTANAQSPFTITISGANHFTIGDKVTFHAELQNTSSSSRFFCMADNYTTVVKDESGKKIEPKPHRGEGFRSGPCGAVKPGQIGTQMEDQNLDEEYDLRRPGLYDVRFRRYIDQQNPNAGFVESNELKFRMAFPEPSSTQ